MRIVTYLILFVSAFSFANAQEEEYRWLEPVNISNLNSAYDDFAPSWNNFEKQLYFNSTRSGYSYFYTTKMMDSLHFLEPELVKSELNKLNSNQSYITFFSSQTAYLSAYNLLQKRCSLLDWKYLLGFLYNLLRLFF